MLPLPINSSGQGIMVPPPPHFHSAGEVTYAHFSENRQQSRLGHTLQQRAGLRYERQVHEHLGSEWKGYRSSPWIIFDADGERRKCQPDGLWFRPTDHVVVVVEVKLQHMPEAYWQLRHLYEPVVQRLYGDLVKVDVLEVVKSYDPSMPFPEAPILIEDLREVYDLRGRLGVYVWKQ